MTRYSHHLKSTVIFHPLLLSLVQITLLKCSHTEGGNEESKCRNAVDGEKVGIYMDNLGFTGAWDVEAEPEGHTTSLEEHGCNMFSPHLTVLRGATKAGMPAASSRQLQMEPSCSAALGTSQMA